YHPREFGERFSCTHCFAEQQVPRVDSLPWRYSTDGLFRSRNKVEGCLPVLLAFHFFKVYLRSGVNFVPSFDYKDGETPHEADFAIFCSEFGREGVDVLIGEANTPAELGEDEKKKLRTLAERTGAILTFCSLEADFTKSDKRSEERRVGKECRT